MVAFLLKTKVIELRVSWPTKQAERSNAFASFVFSGSANDLRGFEGKYKHGNSLAHLPQQGLLNPRFQRHRLP